VAYAAHVGGFIAGLALVKIFAVGRSAPAPRWRNY
jgi:membrane associated rhomboid family serine protease